MASDALRRLAARFSSTITISGGYSGYSSEKSELLCTQSARASGYSGYSRDPAVPAVPASENVLGTDKASKSLDVPGVPAVPAENDKGANAARPAAEPEPPTRPDEWGLSPYTIRDLACWYEEEGNRRRVGLELDQDALDCDLHQRLTELGVLPEFIAVEFERVMQAVFAVEAPRPEKVTRRVEALGDGGGLMVDCPARAGNAAKPVSFEVLGPAPLGRRCVRCSGGIGVKRIKCGDRVEFLHPGCADRPAGVLAEGPKM